MISLLFLLVEFIEEVVYVFYIFLLFCNLYSVKLIVELKIKVYKSSYFKDSKEERRIIYKEKMIKGIE